MCQVSGHGALSGGLDNAYRFAAAPAALKVADDVVFGLRAHASSLAHSAGATAHVTQRQHLANALPFCHALRPRTARELYVPRLRKPFVVQRVELDARDPGFAGFAVHELRVIQRRQHVLPYFAGRQAGVLATAGRRLRI